MEWNGNDYLVKNMIILDYLFVLFVEWNGMEIGNE